MALVDAQLCPGGVRALLDKLRRVAPAMRALLVSASQAPHPVRGALQAGACGFADKTDDALQFRKAISSVAAGRRYLSPAMAERLADSIGLADLTTREMDVPRLLARGCCNKSIARIQRGALDASNAHFVGLPSTTKGRSPQGPALVQAPPDPQLQPLVCSSCHWRECRPGIRLACQARRCGQREFLNEDLQVVNLPSTLVTAPPIEIWPIVVRRVAIPADVEQILLQPLQARR
jgi:hypothetical protein